MALFTTILLLLGIAIPELCPLWQLREAIAKTGSRSGYQMRFKGSLALAHRILFRETSVIKRQSKDIIFSEKKVLFNSPPLVLDNSFVERVHEHKHLGIYLSSTLCWTR